VALKTAEFFEGKVSGKNPIPRGASFAVAVASFPSSPARFLT